MKRLCLLLISTAALAQAPPKPTFADLALAYVRSVAYLKDAQLRAANAQLEAEHALSEMKAGCEGTVSGAEVLRPVCTVPK
jgi:hypothetical protein